MTKLKYFLLIIAISLLMGCEKDNVINIGFLGTLTGQFSEVGVHEMYGTQLAIKEVNELGGIDNKKVVLHVRDDEADPEIALQALKELKSLGCSLVIGPSLSIVAVEVIEYANENDMLLLSPSVGTDELSDIDDNLIRNVSTVSEEARFISSFIDEGTAKKVILIYDEHNLVLTKYHLKGYREYFDSVGWNNEDRLEIPIDSSAESLGILSYSEVINNVDAIILATSNVDAAKIINQIRIELGNSVPIHLSSWASAGIINGISSNGDTNIYTYDQYFEDESASSFRFRNNFYDIFGVYPGMLSTNAYDLTSILIDGIAETGNMKVEMIKNYIISKNTFEGVNQRFTINKYGDSESEIYISKIINGENVPLDEN